MRFFVLLMSRVPRGQRGLGHGLDPKISGLGLAVGPWAKILICNKKTNTVKLFLSLF